MARARGTRKSSKKRTVKATKHSKTSKKEVDVRSLADISKLVDLIKGNTITLVLIYADWCGHCKTFKDDVWSKLKTMPDRKVSLAEVNADVLQETPLASAKIDGFPSVVPIGSDMKMPDLKDEEGQPTNALPNTRDMGMMETIVKSNADEMLSNIPSAATLYTAEPAESAESAEPIPEPFTDIITPASIEPPASEEDIIMGSSLPAQYNDILRSVQSTKNLSVAPASRQEGGSLYNSLKKNQKQRTTRRRMNKRGSRRRYRK